MSESAPSEPSATHFHAAVNEPKPAHPAILEALLQAGAQVRAADFPTGNGRIDEILRRFGAVEEPT